MKPENLLKTIVNHAKKHHWALSTRQGRTTHLFVQIVDHNGCKRGSVISFHRGKDINPHRASKILKQLGVY